MKKIVAIAFALLLTFSLAACSAKEAVQDAVRDAVDGGTSAVATNSGDTEDPTSQSDGATNGNSADDSTVEGRLAKAGLTLEAIQPETFAEATLYNCGDDKVVLYLTNGSGLLGAAVMQPLVEKIMAATAAASDNGKNWETYYGLGDPVELDMSDINYDAFFFIGQWSYVVKGQWITVTVGVLNAEEPEGQENYSWEVTLDFLY
ncbi:MAG: hypothetical protein GXY32_05935 [Ruminococcaceae bacterium]|nr:hypothetical protein [Oscillospiraceae bacterium]